VFLLVDGLGLGSPDPTLNPVHSGICPHLEVLLAHEAVPIDAGMGVPGLPQSATGQTALLTGVNAAEAMGRHVEGFPGPALREIIRQHNLYDRLAALGVRSTFANAYYVTDAADVHTRRIQSVTTVSALKAFGTVRDVAALREGRAVYQDLTRSSLRDKGYDGPLVTPEASAGTLLDIAGEYDFTLFEYFQTDRAGHKGSPEDVRRVLALFDAFLGVVALFGRRPGCLFVMTSDHGNIEEAGSPQHSANPVPFVAVGEGAAFLRERVRSVTDVTPALVELYRTRNEA
jgi:hypothetical protein